MSLTTNAQMPPPPPPKTLISAGVNMSGSCTSCDLSNRTMPRISLRGSNFMGSNFSRSNLSGGQFNGSNLAGSNFHKAYLMRIVGREADMRRVNFRDATMTEAELIHSNLSNADLRRADLTDGNFSHSRFVKSNLSNSDAQNANFKFCDFTQANLKNANFKGANFSNARFEQTVFGQAELNNAIFEKARFNGVDLSSVKNLRAEQLARACADEATILPPHLKRVAVLKPCPIPPAKPTMITMAQTASLPATASNTGLVIGIHMQQNDIENISRGFNKAYAPLKLSAKQATTNSVIDLAIQEIDASLRELPLESPLHKRLIKSKALLEQAKSSH